MVKICLVNAATHRIAVQLDHRADRHPARIQSALNQRVVSSLLRQTGGRLFALSFLPLIRISNSYALCNNSCVSLNMALFGALGTQVAHKKFRQSSVIEGIGNYVFQQ